jgi:hypothetical protein
MKDDCREVGLRPGLRGVSILIGGETRWAGIDLVRDAGAWVASARAFCATAREGRGMTVGFQPIAGEPIVSAIRVTPRP